MSPESAFGWPPIFRMQDKQSSTCGRFLLGFLRSDIIQIYDMLTDVWLEPDAEPDLVNRLSQGETVDLDSTADGFCGGGMGAVGHGGLSMELTTGQIDVLAADPNWLIAAIHNLPLVGQGVILRLRFLVR